MNISLAAGWRRSHCQRVNQLLRAVVLGTGLLIAARADAANRVIVDASVAPETLPPLSTAQARALGSLARRLQAQPPRCVPFVQTKHLRSLPHALQFRGDLSVAPDGTIRWRLVQPLMVEYLFSARGAWRRPTATASWESLGLSGGASTATFRVLAALVNLDAVALQKYFVVTYTDGTPVRVDAVPRDARLRAVIERAMVEVATVGAGAQVERVELREGNGDWSQFRFYGSAIASGAVAVANGATDGKPPGVTSDGQRCPPVPATP